MFKINIQNQILKVATFTVAIFVFGLLGLTSKAQAQDKSFVYPNIDVDVVLNKDSTMDVTETLTYRFNGTFHGVFREITLENFINKDKCKQNAVLQCGGFEFLIVTDVLDGNGQSIKGKYKEFDTSDNSILQRRHRVEWEFSPNGRYFNNETFSWTIKYKVFGSLGYFEDYDLFYWNALFEDRDEIVEHFNFDLHLPANIVYKSDEMQVLGSGFDYTTTYDSAAHTLNIKSDNVPGNNDYTVLMKLPKGLIDEYAKLNLNLDPDKEEVQFYGLSIPDVSDHLYGIPSGTQNFVFSKSGYYSQTIELSFKPGETKELTVNLQPTLFTRIIQLVIIAANVLFCLFIPAFLYFLYSWWQRKGRDRGGRTTIVPWFEPPDNIPPYLLGSLKDEKVDLTDITSSIIDLAYRGYIKIKELGEKKVTDYQLIKQKDFDDPKLTEGERQLLKGLFGGASISGSSILESLNLDKFIEDATQTDTVNIKDLKYSFYTKLPSLKNKIYDEMVARGYFDRRPDKIRTSYLGFGIAALVIGCGFSFVTTLIGIFTLPIALVVVGLGLIVISFFMPSKTPKGTEIFEQAKGFKMYLETAERFRVQKLTPETFEKFLSYAMVFKIEKSWADKFKDIYKKMPDWYQGRPGSTFNALYLADSLGRFNSTTGSTMVSTPRSSGSSGGGWSGGGGFSGGFSGGGGGGGGGGAW